VTRTVFKRATYFVATAAVAASVLLPSGAVAGEVPAAGTVQAGFYTDNFYATSDLDGIAAAAGTRVTFGGTFNSITENDGVSTASWSNTREILDGVWRGRATPFASVVAPGSAYAIARGDFDAKIAEWASHVKQFLDLGGGRSVIIAPLQEMNGDWTKYGCDPGNFKVAYRKFVDAFRQAGMGDTQVRWVFAPNGWTSPGCGKIADYYPGDTYVDAIGISAYNSGTCVGTRWESVPSVFGPALAELRSTVNAQKPYLIAQTAAPRSTSCGGDQDAWTRDMFAYLAEDPNVVGLVWFNHVKETNWKVWESSRLTQGWIDGMSRSSTTYQWPLTSWFTSGPLTVGAPAGPGDSIVIVGGTAAVSQQVEWHILADMGGMPQRIAGANRYDTAARISRRYTAPGVDAAFVATGLGYADALSLGAAAGFQRGPLLLTATFSIPTETRAELVRLNPRQIYVAGGESAVSAAVVQDLKQYATSGTVVRLSGPNRYATGTAISRAFHAGGAGTVFVTTGTNFPDALSAGAAASVANAPVLLNPRDGLHPSVRSELIRLNPEKVIMVGGEAALGSAVFDQIRAMGITTERWSGTNRYATSVVVSQQSNTAPAAMVFLATGESFPDALAAVAAAGTLGVPLLLTQRDAVPPNVSGEIVRLLK